LDFSVKILGSASAFASNGRSHSSQVLTHHNTHFLIDCGENTQNLLRLYKVNFNKIKVIFISHLHGDHYLGLFGLMSTMNLMGRTKPLHIVGPIGLKEIITVQLKYSGSIISYPLTLDEITADKPLDVYESDLISVKSIPLIHRVPTRGYLFTEKQKDRKLNTEIAPSYLTPNQIKALKNGENVTMADGTSFLSKDLTFDPAPIRSYAYCSDTKYNESIIPLIKRCTLLYHESTFLDNLADRAEKTQHSTAKQAATIALKAEVKNLIIGHFSARYPDLTPLLEEAKTVFENVQLAEEGVTFEII
jgi:ribonuclease Z